MVCTVFHISSGWFHYKELSLTTSLLGKQGVQETLRALSLSLSLSRGGGEHLHCNVTQHITNEHLPLDNTHFPTERLDTSNLRT